MGSRFFRRIKIAPGLNLNLSKKGASLSIGPRGAKYTIGSSGTRKTVSIPGTGLYFTSTSKKSSVKAPKISTSYNNKLNIGLLERLFVPRDKKAFIDGCKNFLKDNEIKALNEFRKVTHPDCLFMCGLIYFKQKNNKESLKYFEIIKNNPNKLGHLFNEFEVYPSFELKITNEISTELTTDLRSLCLLLAELYQEKQMYAEAIAVLNVIIESFPSDLIAKLSISEIFLELENKEYYKQLLDIIDDLENETEIHACLLYYKAIALNRLGLNAAATELLTRALRRKKDRSEDLLKSIRYLRANIYLEIGQKSKAKKDLELIYSTDPHFENVESLLF